MELVGIFIVCEFCCVMSLALVVFSITRRSLIKFLLSMISAVILVFISLYSGYVYYSFKDFDKYELYNTVSVNLNELKLSNNSIKFINNNVDLKLSDSTGQSCSISLDTNYVLSILNDGNKLSRCFTKLDGSCISSMYWDTVNIVLKPTSNSKLIGFLTLKPLDYFYKADYSVVHKTQSIAVKGVVKSRLDTSNLESTFYSIGQTVFYGEDTDCNILSLIDESVDEVVYYKEKSKDDLIVNYKFQRR